MIEPHLLLEVLFVHLPCHEPRWTSQLVGVIGFVSFDRKNRRTEIGYWLAAEVQGRGIMTRACRAIVAYAFHELTFNRVEIRCATGNARSASITGRLGFRLEGTLRDAEWLHDHFVDHYVYAMLASEWQRLDGRDRV